MKKKMGVIVTERLQRTENGEHNEDTLKEVLVARGSKYGPFISNAVVSQELKTTFRSTPNWNDLSLDVKEMLDVMALKISRILTGDPEYDDNYVDIAGYAQIVVDRIRKGKQ
jgi:hypothetical protein